MQRVVAALVTHDADPQRSPMRRAGTTALVSLLIASLAVGGAALYGLLTGQSNVDPRDPKVVFQEKGTGARFVYLDSDRKMHPVLNYTSGLLLAQAQTPELKSVPTDKLASVPLGAPLGIKGAPDSLPSTGALLTDRWSVCTDNHGAGHAPRSTLLVGDQLTDGTVAAKAARGMLVIDPVGRTYLVSGNRKFTISPDRFPVAKRVLGWNDQVPWPVSAAWINAVPDGPALAPPPIPATTGPSPVEGVRVGQVVTDSGHQQFSVILPDGPAALTKMQALLMQTTPGVGEPIQLDNFANLPPESKTRLSDANNPNGLPATVPDLVDSPPDRVCITLPVDPKSGDGIRIDPTVPTGVAVAGTQVPPGTIQADLVHVARGKGAVASAAASSTAPEGSGTVAVVTDTGRGYPLANRSLLAKLGYDGIKPTQIPSQLFSMLPRGPSLDPAAARQTDPQG
jgi:type VII secretion protein EccB